MKGLTQLQTLGLTSTQVTDAGLEQLKGLTQLQFWTSTLLRSAMPAWSI